MIEQPTPVVLITEVPTRINEIKSIEIAEGKNHNREKSRQPNSLPSSRQFQPTFPLLRPPIYTFSLFNNLCAAQATNAKSAVS